MNFDRLDLDGIGSPTALAARIHQLAPELPRRVPIEEICRGLDILSIDEIDTDGFEAALVMDEHKASGAILVAKNRREERRRYSLAHELGHFLIPTHRPSAGSGFECSLADLHLLDAKATDRRRRIEAEANRFAAHLLMPPDAIRASIRKTSSELESIVTIAQEFGVSKEAMARTWVASHRDPVAVLITQRGRILRRYRHDDFPWLPDQVSRLPDDAILAAAQPAGTYSAIEEGDPDFWFSDRDAATVLSLSQQVLAQRDGYALVLLQVELDDASET